MRTVAELWQQRRHEQTKLAQYQYQRRHLHDVPDSVYTTEADAILRAEELDFQIDYTRAIVADLNERILDALQVPGVHGSASQT